MFSPAFDDLVQRLRVLPGIGPKSAQRMALHLLARNRHGALDLAHALNHAMHSIQTCSVCRSLSEHEICQICASSERDQQALCVVESPADVMAIEQSGGFKGRYFVLGGHLSPLDGIRPDEKVAGRTPRDSSLLARRLTRADWQIAARSQYPGRN